MNRMTFTIPKDLKKALEKGAKQMNISQAAFIRIKLTEALKGIINQGNVKEK